MSECLSELEQQLVDTRAELEDLKERIPYVDDPKELRALRTQLYTAQERLVVIQTKMKKSGPPRKASKVRAGTYGGKVRTSGGGRSITDAFSDYTRWVESEREADAPEGPTKHEQQVDAMTVGLSRATDRQREMLLMFGHGLSMTEIARILNVDKSTVSRTIARGTKRVKRYVASAEAAEKARGTATIPDKQKPASVDLFTLLSEVTIFTPVERQAILAAANGNSIGTIAVIINKNIDEAQTILASARKKIKFSSDK